MMPKDTWVPSHSEDDITPPAAALQPIKRDDVNAAIDGYVDAKIARYMDRQKHVSHSTADNGPWQIAKAMISILATVSLLGGIPAAFGLAYVMVHQWHMVGGRWIVWGLTFWGIANLCWGGYLAYQLLWANSPQHMGRFAIKTDSGIIRARDRYQHAENMQRLAIDSKRLDAQQDYNRAVMAQHSARIPKAHASPSAAPGGIPRPPRPAGVDAEAAAPIAMSDGVRALLDFMADIYATLPQSVSKSGHIARDIKIPFGQRGAMNKAQRAAALDAISTMGRMGDAWLIRYDKQARQYQINVNRYPGYDDAAGAVLALPKRLGG